MRWIQIPFLFLIHPFPISHFYSTPVSHIPFADPLFPFPLNTAIQRFGKIVRLFTLPKNDTQLHTLERNRYTWSPRTPKSEGTRPMGLIGWLRLWCEFKVTVCNSQEQSSFRHFSWFTARQFSFFANSAGVATNCRSARKLSINRLPRDQSFNQSNFITFYNDSETVGQWLRGMQQTYLLLKLTRLFRRYFPLTSVLGSDHGYRLPAWHHCFSVWSSL